ncbi:chitin-binding protein, partial [Streptomyces solincola]
SAPSASEAEAEVKQAAPSPADEGNGPDAAGAAAPSAVPSAAASSPAADGQQTAATGGLAETGGDAGTAYLAMGGAAVLALGAALMFAVNRRKAAPAGRHSR